MTPPPPFVEDGGSIGGAGAALVGAVGLDARTVSCHCCTNGEGYMAFSLRGVDGDCPLLPPPGVQYCGAPAGAGYLAATRASSGGRCRCSNGNFVIFF